MPIFPDSHAKEVDRRGLLLAALVHLAVALWLYQDALLAAGLRVVGGPETEIWPFLWARAWVGQTLLAGELPLRTTLLDFPAGGALWAKDPVLMALTLPVQLLWGVPAAFNAGGVLLFTLSGAGFFLLATELGASRWGAVLAGLTFAFCPHALGEAFNANTEAFAGGWCALWLWALVRLLRAPGLATLSLAVGLLWILLVTNQYFSWAMALSSCPLVWLILRDLPQRRRRLLVLGGALGLTLLLFAPVGWLIDSGISASDKLNTMPEQIPLMVPNVSDLRHLLEPLAPLRGTLQLNSPFQDLVYPGYLLLVLALIAPALGPRGPWRWAFPVAGLFFLVLSLGPVAMYDAELVTLGGRPVPLPWRYLVSGWPVWGKMSLPHRMAIPAGLFFSLSLAWSYHGLQSRFAGRSRTARAVAPALALACLAEILFYPPYHLPLATVSAAAPVHARLLAGHPRPGAVLNLPLQSHHLQLRRYMWWQAAHGRPISASLRHSSYPTIAARVPWLGRVADFEKFHRRDMPNPDAGAAAQLARQGFGFVIFHRWAWCRLFPEVDLSRWRATLQGSLGEGVPLSDGTVVFSLDETSALALERETRQRLGPGALGGPNGWTCPTAPPPGS